MAKTKSTYWAKGLQYAQDVLAGRIPACRWVRLACQRQIDDLARQKSPEWAFRFDVAKAEKVCAFIECLPHIKGVWGGKPIRLEPWQCFVLGTAFGWIHKKTKLRRFRTAYIEVPRKNAKSTLSSGVGMYMLTEDEEEGAEVYSAATTRDQAKIVFGDAQAMARKSPDLLEHYGVQVGAHNINVLRTSSKFEALSADGDTLDGKNVHCAIIDELHAHKTRDVFDVMETGTGSRSQSLLWIITTAGSNKAGICYEQRDYVTKLLERVSDDESYFGIIYTIDLESKDADGNVIPGDDWTTEEAWKKANPNYGVSIYPEDIRRLALKAQQVPSAVNNFLTKRLCVWVTADVGLFDMSAWISCGDGKLKPEDFVDCPCWIGVDLGFVNDIAAVVKLFVKDGKYYYFGRYYLPEHTVEASGNSQYSGWHRTGRLTVTDGSATDADVIVADIADDIQRFKVQEVAFDPYQARTVADPLKRLGVDERLLIAHPQQVSTMSPATEALMKRILEKSVGHDGCPIMTWALSNVVGHFDVKSNVYPRKERADNKIDPAIAAIMATGRAGLMEESVYESRGLLVI